MILKHIDTIEENEIIAKNIQKDASILFNAGKEFNSDVREKLKELGFQYLYVEGEPTTEEKFFSIFYEIENEVETEEHIDEKIDFLIENKVDNSKILSIFQKLHDIEAKKKIIDYSFKDFSDEVMNFSLRTLKTSDDIGLLSALFEHLQEKIDKDNLANMISLLDEGSHFVKSRMKTLFKKRFSLRELYDLDCRLKEKGQCYDFFQKDLNFSIMPPRHFWDTKVMIFSYRPDEHRILKAYLENLEMQVYLEKYADFEKKILQKNPHIILLDFDGSKETKDFFERINHSYKDRIIMITTSSIDKEAFLSTIRKGASYFIKKPYSLPKIQNYLTFLIKNGKILESFSSPNDRLKVEIRHFGKNTRKFDFTGEITSYTAGQIQNNVYKYLSLNNYFFYDMANVVRIDSAGVNFLLKSYDITTDSDNDLFICNVSDEIRQGLQGFSQKLVFIDKWEELVWK